MQDPWDALSPRLPVEELVREPLDIGGADDGPRRRAAVAAMLAAVGLPSSGGFLAARVHELSGGQLQRIALARALIARPALLVADEPTSMLDASEQARLLVVLRELQVQMGLALVLVSHDLALVRKATDRIVVLDEGRVAETGSSQRVGTRPASATGRRLLAAAPSFEAGEG
jgi:peptide/nickel transport system ATP-binding protein